MQYGDLLLGIQCHPHPMAVDVPDAYSDVVERGLKVAGTMPRECLSHQCSSCSG